jgi:hypothetical protein
VPLEKPSAVGSDSAYGCAAPTVDAVTATCSVTMGADSPVHGVDAKNCTWPAARRTRAVDASYAMTVAATQLGISARRGL